MPKIEFPLTNKGDTGATGDKGDKGDKGDPGPVNEGDMLKYAIVALLLFGKNDKINFM